MEQGNQKLDTAQVSFILILISLIAMCLIAIYQ